MKRYVYITANARAVPAGSTQNRLEILANDQRIYNRSCAITFWKQADQMMYPLK